MPRHSASTLFVVLCIAVRYSIMTTTVGYADEIDRPNIVFILADDLGWGDTTLFGTTDFYQTPNIERLAQRGMTFSQAYAASPLCSPTRASILTGQKLNNLQQDLGEEDNLATEHPDIVRRLDQQIEQFLVDTQAVLPTPNPDYDPESARLIKLGITPLQHCQMRIEDAVLRLTATGTDPYFKLEPSEPLPSGEFKLELRMKSTGKGESRLYWHTLDTRPAHHRSRSVAFRPTHDNQFHDYQAEFTTDKALLALRLDPIQSPGKCEFSFMRLLNAQDQVLASWDFRNINKKAKESESNRQSAAKSSSAKTNERGKLTAAEPLTEDEQYRQLVVGVWEDDYKGKRTMYLKGDGTGKMVVQLSGMSAALFASKLEFDMVWSLKDGRLKKRTISGRPKRRVDMILKMMGDRVDEKILQLDENRLLLLDQDGKTRYDWRRKR